MQSEAGHPGSIVVVTGPIGSGKTTLAQGLARVVRMSGGHAAAIDMDDLVEMAAGDDWSRVTTAHWATARKLCARVCESLLDESYSYVFVSGPFFNEGER